MRKRADLLVSFIRYNAVAIFATAIDFSTFLFLKDIVGLWYVLSGFLGAVFGGIVAFVLNRNWVFVSQDKNVKIQIIKYLLTWGGSIMLNTYGLYLLVENTHINETTAKILVAILVGISYNFLMSRFVIFKK